MITYLQEENEILKEQLESKGSRMFDKLLIGEKSLEKAVNPRYCRIKIRKFEESQACLAPVAYTVLMLGW